MKKEKKEVETELTESSILETRILVGGGDGDVLDPESRQESADRVNRMDLARLLLASFIVIALSYTHHHRTNLSSF